MNSKMAILILGLLAMFLLISSEEAASNSKEVTNGVGDAKYPGGSYGGGNPGYGGGGYPGNGGGYPGNGGGYPGNGGGYPGNGGGYPGGGGGGYPGNGGGYPGGGGGYPGRGGGYPGRGGGYPGRGGAGRGGGNCRFGCCRGAYHGGCGRCCNYAGEVVVAQTHDNTHN